MKKIACSLALLGSLCGGDALAWGGDGHRIVGALADRLVAGTRAGQEVAALLLPGESLETIATWPDCVKGTACGPQTAEMLAYVAANPRHDTYHYTNITFQADHYADGAPGSADSDIVQILKQAIAVLSGQAGQDKPTVNPHHFPRRQALILLAHLCGDISQPLHVGEAYIGADGRFAAPAGPGAIASLSATRGGNRLLASGAGLATLDPVSFHQYWDSLVVSGALAAAGAATPRQFVRGALAEAERPASGEGDPATWPYQWAGDTLRVAAAAYAGLAPGPRGQQTGRDGATYDVWALPLPDDYAANSASIARQQLIKGGRRLAALLQAIWPAPG